MTIVPNRAALTLCVMLATLMQSLDGTIANVALPYIQGSLAASQDQVNWVLTSYIVAAAIMTTPTGWLSGRFGRTRVFLCAVFGFTVASIACALSQSISQMVVARLIQGMCGASLVPLSQTVMFDIYPVEKRASAMALWGVGVMVGPVIGPTLGGWLTDHYTWRWVFYINVPFGIVCLFGLLKFLPETKRSAARFDWTGFAAISLGVGALQTMLDRGEQLDWFASREIVIEAFVAVAGIYCFIVHFFMAENPFVSPRLLRDTNFCVGVTCIFMMGLIVYSNLALMSPYLQTLMGYPVLTAGIALAPRGVGTMLGMFMCGRLVGRGFSVRILILAGLAILIYSLYDSLGFTQDVSEKEVIIIGALQGFSMGLIFVCLSLVTFTTLPASLRTQGTSINSLLRNLGSSLGISITGALLVRNSQINHATIAASVTPFNRLLQTGAAAHFWNPAHVQGASILDAVVNVQAITIAYSDDFKLLMIVAIVVAPLVLFIREPRLNAMEGHSAAAAME